MSRDLVADLAVIEARPQDVAGITAKLICREQACPAAIRRAWAAEAILARLVEYCPRGNDDVGALWQIVQDARVLLGKEQS
jgi:hypothetical protein